MSDVWNDAAEAQQGPKQYFGQLLTDAFYVYIPLTKGAHKEPFDPGRHDLGQRFVQVKVGAICTKKDGSTYDLNRDYICPKPGSTLGKEWAQIVNPSLKKLGIHPRDLNDKWASWEMVETGRSWESKTTGELVKGTAFKFTEFYTDEAACRTAEAAFYNRSEDGLAEKPQDASATHPMPPEDDEANDDQERANAAVFLPTLWQLAQGDADAFYASIANQPNLAKFFSSNSPEVAAIVAGS